MRRISKMKLFATPKSVKDIEMWIEQHPKRERARLYTVMGMTWNFLSEIVEESDKLEYRRSQANKSARDKSMNKIKRMMSK